MLRLLGMGHGTYAAIDSLNPRFTAGAPKLCVAVETESKPRAEESELTTRLLAGFPGLAKHECRVTGMGLLLTAPGTGIQLVPGDASANQAHLLEHVMIDLLAVFEPCVMRSGVTCAWRDPPERNDVFVECRDAQMGAAVATIALLALDAALDGRELTPLYRDIARVWAAMDRGKAQGWSPARFERESGLPRVRVERALGLLAQSRLLTEEKPALNLSGVPLYRSA